MSVTNSVIVNFFARRIIGAIDLKDRFLEPVFTSIKRHTKGLLTGPSPNDDSGAWLESVTITDGANANDITLGNLYGVDGSGEYLSLDSGDNDITDVPFENALGVTFYVAARSEAVPVDVGFDVAAGIIKYDRHQRRIGHLEEPTAVIVSGGGLEFTIGNHLLDASDDFTSRTAIVYLKNPVATSAVTAIETVVVSSGDKVVTVAQFGQVSPSLTASDYEIVITGPAITRHAAIETTPPWAFIGTVVGGTVPRTYSVADQISILPLADVQDNFDELIDRGWITNPSLTYAATTVTVAGAGVAYYKGRLIDTPTSGALTPGNSFSGFLYLDAADNTWKLTAVWATAFSGSCVPYQHIVTNSGGTIIGRGAALGLVKKFNKTLRITVSSDTNYPGAFSSLRDALAAVAGARLYTTSIPAALIEVVGKISETSVINLDAIPLKYVRIVGRSLSMYPGSDTGEHSMARISWNFNGGLFTAATATISASFENIWFQPEAAGTVSADSIFNLSSTSQVSGLRFERCGFDMNNRYNSTSGVAAHVIYSTSSNNLIDVTFSHCTVYAADAICYATLAAFQRLSVSDCFINWTNVISGITTKYGGFWSDSGQSLDVSILNTVYSGRGTFLNLLGGVDRLNVSNNKLETGVFAVDGPLFNCGVSNRVTVSDNSISRDSVGNPTTNVFTILTASSGVADIFFHDNCIASGSSADATAIYLDGSTGSALFGVQIHNNYIYSVAEGIILYGGHKGAVISKNQITAGAVGIKLDGTLAPAVNCLIADNIISVGSSLDAINIGASCTGNIVSGNHCDGTGAGAANITSTASDQSIVGNIAGDITTVSPSNVALNITSGALSTGIGTNSIIALNKVGGALDPTMASSILVGNIASVTSMVLANVNALGNRLTVSGSHQVGGSNLAGNYISGALILGGTSNSSTLSSNFFTAGITFEDSTNKHALTGNAITGAVLIDNTAGRLAISGNVMSDNLTFNATSLYNAGSGNVVVGSVSIASEYGAFVGNHVGCGADTGSSGDDGLITLQLGSSEWAVIGNNASISAISVTNLFITPAATDPLNTDIT